MSKYTRIASTMAWGDLEVWAGLDDAGNQRLYPIGGTPLEAWRTDYTQTPPWLVADDLVEPEDWRRIWGELRDAGLTPRPTPII